MPLVRIDVIEERRTRAQLRPLDGEVVRPVAPVHVPAVLPQGCAEEQGRPRYAGPCLRLLAGCR
jgi:hypothetical protein